MQQQGINANVMSLGGIAIATGAMAAAAGLAVTLLLVSTLRFALVGGVGLLWALGHNLSVASAVGFIAPAGVAAEFGVIMLMYLKQAWQKRLAEGHDSDDDLLDAIREGAVLRVRPKAMTVAVAVAVAAIVAGRLPLFWGDGTGSEVMQRIAAPMVGGMLSAPLLSMFVIPAAYRPRRRPRLGAPASTRRAVSTASF